MNKLKWEADTSKLKVGMNIVAEFENHTISSGHIINDLYCMWMKSDFDDDYTGFCAIDGIVRWAEYPKETTSNG
jgi:hypothetical protein